MLPRCALGAPLSVNALTGEKPSVTRGLLCQRHAMAAAPTASAGSSAGGKHTETLPAATPALPAGTGKESAGGETPADGSGKTPAGGKESAGGETPAPAWWRSRVWCFVEGEFKLLSQMKPLTKAEGATGLLVKATEFQELLHARGGELRNVTGNLCSTPPLDMSLAGDAVSLEKADSVAKFYFWDQATNTPQAPHHWPRNGNIPIALRAAALPVVQKRFGLDGLVVAFWWSFARAKEMKLPNERIAEFRRLCRNAVLDYKIFKTDEDVFLATVQLLETVEAHHQHFGFSGFRKVLVVQSTKATLARKGGGKTPSNAEVAEYLKENIKWGDPRNVPSEHVVDVLLTIGKHVLKNPRALHCIEHAEVLWGRSHLFDEYSKVKIICGRAHSPDELAWLVEGLFVSMKRATPADAFPDKLSQAELKNRVGELSMWKLTRDLVTWFWSTYPFPNHPDIMAKLKSPLQWDRAFPANTGEVDFGWLATVPRPLSMAIDMMRDTFGHTGLVTSVLKGLLASPPAGPLDAWKNFFAVVFKETWEDFVKAYAKITEKKAETGGETPAVDAAVATPDAMDTDDKLGVVGEKDSIKSLAKNRAEELVSRWLTTLVPTVMVGTALADLVKAKNQVLALGTMLAVFNPRCDDEARVPPKKNLYRHFPPVNGLRLEAFCTAVDQIMQPGRDLVAILEGKVWSNRNTIVETIAKMRWKCRVLSVHYKEEQWRDLAQTGTQKKKFLKTQGFGTMSLAETVYICYRGKVPKLQETERRFVNPGASVSSDCWTDVKVVPESDLSWVSRADRAEVLAGSNFHTQPSEEDDEDNSSADAGGQTYTRRGRALTRNRSSTDVPLFCHPTPPEIIQELIHVFTVQWVALGTPEGGVACKAAMEMNVPTIALVRNERHAQLLKKLLVQAVADDVIKPTSVLYHKPLGERYELIRTPSPSDGSTSECSDVDTVKPGSVTTERKEKKAKGKKDKEKGKETKDAEKKEKKEGRSPKDKKLKKSKDKKEKKSHQEKVISQVVEGKKGVAGHSRGQKTGTDAVPGSTTVLSRLIEAHG